MSSRVISPRAGTAIVIGSSIGGLTVADFNLPGVEINGVEQAIGKSPEGDYADRVVALATEDYDIANKFIESQQMVRSFDWLGEPALRVRVQENWNRLGSMKRAHLEDDRPADMMKGHQG